VEYPRRGWLTSVCWHIAEDAAAAAAEGQSADMATVGDGVAPAPRMTMNEPSQNQATALIVRR
jgi:hypothetical protein